MWLWLRKQIEAGLIPLALLFILSGAGMPAASLKPASAGSAERKPEAAAAEAAARAEQLLGEWRAESTRAAIEKYKEAASLYEKAGELAAQARALERAGNAHKSLQEFQSALEYYNRALLIARKMKDRSTEGELLSEIGYAYLNAGKLPEALRLCTDALETSRSANNRSGEAQALNNIGEVHYGFGDLQLSFDFYERALGLWNELNDARGKALTLLNFGYSYSDLGKTREAFSSYEEALALWRQVGDRRQEAATITAIGRLYSRIGEVQEALNFFSQAMQIIQPIGDPIEEARIVNGMADIHFKLGDKQKAIGHYNQGLRLFRSAKYSSGEATTLYDLGGVYHALGDEQKALECFQRSLSISKATGDHRLQYFALRDSGKVYEALGDRATALRMYSGALLFYQSEQDRRGEADTLNLMARICEGLGQKQKALDYYNRALALSRNAEYRFGETATLYNLARLERERGDAAQARKLIEEAIAIVESLRSKVESQDLRTSYFASVRRHYELYIDLLMQLNDRHPAQGFDRLALEASERARARALVETLAAARVGIRRKADPALLEREQLLRREMDERAQQMRLAAGNGAKAEAAAIARQIEELASRHRELSAQIRASSLSFTAELQPQPLSLSEIQQRVLDDDTALLEYSLGDEKSYLWVVTRQALKSYTLAARAEIEALANRSREMLVAPQMREGESFEDYKARVRDAESKYWEAAAALSRMLIGPAASELSAKRLIVVADGALHYVPFGALPVPDLSEREAVPLIVEHEIACLPSASALATLRAEASRRQAALKTVAVFADPVFEQEDPRLNKEGQSGELAARARGVEAYRALRSAGVLSGGQEIPRLFASREEAEAIMSVALSELSFKAIGFDANKAAATSAELSRYRIIHFATHGVLDNENPDLSGLVLSLFDESGQPRDGFLGINDIYNMELPAELVVLSACNTGLGKDVKGEGVIGLTRGFMYAGAARVMASLWKVDDDATAELMKRFYKHMLEERKSPAAALRQAQIDMWQQKRWRAPYFWAAFVLQGEYKGEIDASPATASRNDEERLLPILLPAAVFASLIAGIFALKRRLRKGHA